MKKRLKKKSIFNIIIIGLMIVMMTIARAQTIYTLTDSDLTVDENGVITACSYDFQNTDIKIPDYVNGKMVTGIVSNLSGVFSDKDITSVEFPESLTFIGNWAFYNNELTSIVLPDGLTYVGEWSFSNNQLASIELPPSLISIDDYAFHRNKFTSIEFPSSLTSIGEAAFHSNQLTNVLFLINTSFLVEPSSLKIVKKEAFHRNENLQSVILPSKHKTEGFLGFEDNDGLQVTIIEDFEKSYYAKFEAYELQDSDLTVDQNGVITACNYDFEITEIIIPGEVNGVIVTGIADGDGSMGIFQNNDILSVEFPSSLSFIGEKAFQSNQLTSVSLPEGLASIGRSAFQQNKLTSVEFSLEPSSLKSIAENAFSNNSGLTQIVLPTNHKIETFLYFQDNKGNEVDVMKDFSKSYFSRFSPYTLTSSDLTVDQNGVITACSYDFEITDIIIPTVVDGVTITGIDNSEIGIFEGKNITSVEFPEGLTSIGYAVFESNQLTSVIFPEGLTSIGNGAFQSNLLTSVSFPESLISIGESAFGDNQLTSVTFLEGLTSIGNGAFQSNPLTSVSFPESLISIGESAFAYNQLTSVSFSEGLISIGETAFQENKLKSLLFPSSLTSIGHAAFYSNQLTNVSFSTPSSISLISRSVFVNNPGLSSIILPSDNSNEGFIGYLDSQGNKVQATESGTYAITDFFLGYQVGTGNGGTDEGNGGTVLSLSDDFGGQLMMSYPNPVQTMLTVERGADFRGDVSLRVFNPLGKLAFSRSYSRREKDMRVDFTPMPQGMYLLEVSDGAGSQTRTRIMKN